MSRPDLSGLREEIRHRKTAGEKSLEITKDYPLVPIGLIGASLILVHRLRNFKNRGNVRISNYLIYTRMYAQGLIVGSMTLCIGWGVAKFYYKKWFTTPEDTSAAIPDISSK